MYERQIIRDFAKSDSWVDTAKSEHRKLVDQEIRLGEQEDKTAAVTAAAAAAAAAAKGSK